MPERDEFEQLLVENLERIRRIVRFVCRRNGAGDDEAQECLSWILLKLVENDYSIFRKFRGESSLTTYLTVAIAMLVRDYRVQQWGRWRPSAAALRMGPTAMRLETLIYRDRLTYGQAVSTLRTNSSVQLSDREFSAMFAALRARAPLRPREVSNAGLDAVPASVTADAALLDAEADKERAALEAVLQRELRSLPDEDQLIPRLLIFEGLSVADVARGLSIPQKPLYRQIDRLKRELRMRLQQSGITRERVASMLSEVGT